MRLTEPVVRSVLWPLAMCGSQQKSGPLLVLGQRMATQLTLKGLKQTPQILPVQHLIVLSGTQTTLPDPMHGSQTEKCQSATALRMDKDSETDGADVGRD